MKFILFFWRDSGYKQQKENTKLGIWVKNEKERKRKKGKRKWKLPLSEFESQKIKPKESSGNFQKVFER